jgi:xanthine dehydrogenase YagT iron-sulfur-binding subunit
MLPYAPAEPVTLQVNGDSYTLELEPRVTLLDALREVGGALPELAALARTRCPTTTLSGMEPAIRRCHSRTGDGHQSRPGT